MAHTYVLLTSAEADAIDFADERIKTTSKDTMRTNGVDYVLAFVGEPFGLFATKLVHSREALKRVIAGW